MTVVLAVKEQRVGCLPCLFGRHPMHGSTRASISEKTCADRGKTRVSPERALETPERLSRVT